MELSFDEATKKVFELPSVSNEDKLILYGLFKQAKVGDCNTSMPFLNFKEKMKWESWKNYEGLSSQVAKMKYIEKVQELFNK